MSSTTGLSADAERTNLLESQEEVKVDDERQSYILSNYSTLRTNLQWDGATISSMIDKIACVSVLPPGMNLDETVSYRERAVLTEEKEALTARGKEEAVQSSCESIIKYVASRAVTDPLLRDDNPYKQEEKKEEDNDGSDDSSINNDSDDDVKQDHLNTDLIVNMKTETVASKQSMLGSLDVLITPKAQEEEEKGGGGTVADLLAAPGPSPVREISDVILADPCYKMLTEELAGAGGLHAIASSDTDNIGQKKKRKAKAQGKCSKTQIKKSLKFTYLVGSRAFSLVDIVTDALLLYASSQTPDLWFLTLALTISMSSPYIISYSSGVQLYLFRQTFDNVEGFKKILMFLFLLPTGILYFVFLDLADILLHLFRWFYLVLLCRTLQEIGETEQILSEQLGMDRMNWEGFKRQRSIGQLMFESLPQFIFQTMIFYVLNYEMDGQNSISSTQLMISIGSAVINIISTTFKLNLEAKCCRCSFISYALICIKARVGWVPQREHILAAATDYSSGEVATIDYDMSHRPGLLCNIYKHAVEYDFSSTTIRYMMSALQMINNKNNRTTLRIHFRNTLRLLPLQDLIELYALCQKKTIEVMSLKGGNSKYDYDWSSAIAISKNYGKDARLIKHARDDQGLPYIMKLMSLTHYSDRRKIFRDLVQHDFDLNIHDLTTNESIVYTLIRSYDYKNLRYLFQCYAKDKGIIIRLNYHNKDGISPLGVALKLYKHELYIRESAPMPATALTNPHTVPYLWQLLIKYGAELSFPCKKNYSDSSNQGDMSPLKYVLAELRNKVLARHLMAAGAQLYSKEIGSLNELFVNYQLSEEEEWQIPQPNEDSLSLNTAATEDQDLLGMSDAECAWEKDDDYIEHEEEKVVDHSWLQLLCDVAKHCHRPIDFITDDEGNNPLHYFINDFNDKNKHKTRAYKFGDDDNTLRLKRLRHLMHICNGTWSNEKNNDDLYPYQLIIKKRDPDLFFEFANLDDEFKQSIMERKEFVQQMIDWIIAITERITKKYPAGLAKDKKRKKYLDERVQKDVDVQTLDKLFKPKYLGKLIKWPNKYKKQVGADEISLIGTALQRELVQVTLYLKEYWKFPVTRSGRDKIAEIQEMREQRKVLGIEYNRSKSRYNRMSSAQIKSSVTNQGGITQIVPQTQFSNNYGMRRNQQNKQSIANAPAPVLRQATLMQMAANNQISDLSDRIDVDIMGHVDRIRAHQSTEIQIKQEEHKKSRIETIYSFFVEALSTADFITDILVVAELVRHEEVWSISLMILFMISPYLVSHSIMCSLIDSRRESIKLDMLTSSRKGCCNCKLMMINMLALILMTPAAIAWFTFVDVLFMLYLLLSTAIFFITCAKIDISDYMDDFLFKKLLGMSRMQIIGYRRLRTLSQLLFETLPQIILQGYILYYDKKKGGKQLNADEIYISIGVAALHVVLELFIIYLDARASKMSLSHYAVICLGARLNWVPFAHQIRSRIKQQSAMKQKKQFYNFECVQFQPWFFVPFGSEFMYRIEYEFSPSSIKKLGEYFINLQILSSTDAPSNPYLAPVWLYLYKNHTLPVIYLGKTCCRSLDVYSFAEFFRSADKKVTLKSSQLDWTRIIFENTPNTSADNVYLKRLCQEFINYAEIKLITQLAPVVSLSTDDVLLYILDPSQQQSAFNILLILKKYYDENIHFGLSADIMHAVYEIITNQNWIKNNDADPSYSKVIFLLMWYTRRSLYRHQCPNGSLKFIHDTQRETFLTQYIDQTLPPKFEVRYDSNAISPSARYDDGVNKMRTIMILSDTHTAPHKLTSLSPKGNEEKEGSRDSNYEVAPNWDEPQLPNGSYVVNLANEEDDHEIGFEVEFQILECFKFFQPQIEKFLIDLTLRLKRKKEFLRIGDKALFKFFKKVFNKQTVDFLKLIINSPWNVLQHFPVHVRFAELFSRIDPVVRRLEMVHGYGHYLLASAKYRQSNRVQPMQFIIAMDYDNHEDDDGYSNSSYHDESEHLLKNDVTTLNGNSMAQTSNQILDIQTDPAYHGHKSLRQASYVDFIKLPQQMEYQQKINEEPTAQRQSSVRKSKKTFDKSDIMGIGRIEIDFEGFQAIDTVNSVQDEEKGRSMGKIELFTVLPQKTKMMDDKLMLNKVILKQVSFEELLQAKESKLIVDIFDNEILGMFRPIYIGRDRIELMPLKLNIQPSSPTIQVTCDQIRAQITYLLRKFIDATAMKFESVLHKACTLQNVECIQFIHEYQDIFDCNAVNDHYENALHILCKMDDPDLEIFSLVLQLNDLDINQVRFDGKTAFQVLEANTNVDVEKKNEMLKDISAQPSYRAIIKKDAKKVRNVLLLGAPNCGRHSLLKQLQIHYEKRLFSAWQKSIFRSKIIKYMVCSMKLLIKHCGEETIARLGDRDARRIYVMNADNLDTLEHLDKDSFESLERLWDNPAVQAVFFAHGERLGLSDSVRYFLDRIKPISSHNYVPNELDILRAPHTHCEQVFGSKSYRLDDDFASDVQIRWICPSHSAYKILRSQCSEIYHDIDTIIFMVSTTSFIENDKCKTNDNAFMQSLKLFKQFTNDSKFDQTKMVLLFNKTDILKKKIVRNDELLMSLCKSDIHSFDSEDYWDWIDLFQAMFRYQHWKRTVFSYPLSAAHPAKIRSILKELEDIIIQTDIPAITNSDYYTAKALNDVKWIAVLKKKASSESKEMEEEEKQSDTRTQFEFDLTAVSHEKMEEISNDKEINIDYNAMIYKTSTGGAKKNKKKVHFLISMEDAKHDGFVWAKWNKSNLRAIPTHNQAKGYWSTLNAQESGDRQMENDLNGILAILHHKELRTQFDGFTINHHPIRICFDSDRVYRVSWWNMARMSKCNAITVDNVHYLHFQSPLNNRSIEWEWYNNDSGVVKEYDDTCLNQLEASYQANLEASFPQTLLKQYHDKSITNNINNRINKTDPNDTIFNHCILTDLQEFMIKVAKQKDPSYVLRFGFNQNVQISHITQLRIYPNKNNFARDVTRRYDGRNSAWPV